MKKTTVALCMIVRDEEHILERSLDSISDIADQIVIVDTGSVDRTVEIANKFTSEVHHFEWIDDFSAARNFAQQFVNCDYTLRWDADFILREGGMEGLFAAKKRSFFAADLLHMKWNIDHGDDGFPIKSLTNYFFYKSDKFHWVSPIHNKLTPIGDFKPKSHYIEGVEVDHFKDRKIKAGRYDQTARILRAEIARDPANIRLRLNLIEGLLFAGGNEETLSEIEALLDYSLKPGEKIAALESYSRAAVATGKYYEGLNLLAKYEEEFEPNFRFRLAKADLLVFSDLEDALAIYEDHVSRLPTLSGLDVSLNYERLVFHPYNMIGIVQMSLGEFEKARAAFNTAIKLTHMDSSREQVQSHLEKLP